MFWSRTKVIALAIIIFSCYLMEVRQAEASDVYRKIKICITNCAQCKEMYDRYFIGSLCADSCKKYKGELIPDCQDIASIAPFLNIDGLS